MAHQYKNRAAGKRVAMPKFVLVRLESSKNVQPDHENENEKINEKINEQKENSDIDSISFDDMWFTYPKIVDRNFAECMSSRTSGDKSKGEKSKDMGQSY